MEEVIYIGVYDNTNDLRLDSNGSPISLSSVTRIDAQMGLLSVTSENATNDPIRWNVAGFVAGEMRCKFGALEGLSPGSWPCYFIVYDPTNPNGVVFGPVTFHVKALS